ncbi:MAG: hypothetical protein ABH864_06980 [archaeon]
MGDECLAGAETGESRIFDPEDFVVYRPKPKVGDRGLEGTVATVPESEATDSSFDFSSFFKPIVMPRVQTFGVIEGLLGVQERIEVGKLEASIEVLGANYVVCNTAGCDVRGLKYASSGRYCFLCGGEYRVVAPVPDNVVFERDGKPVIVEVEKGVARGVGGENGNGRKNGRAHRHMSFRELAFKEILDAGYLPGDASRIAEDPIQLSNRDVHIYESLESGGFSHVGCFFNQSGEFFGEAYREGRFDDVLGIADKLAELEGIKLGVELKRSRMSIYPSLRGSQPSWSKNIGSELVPQFEYLLRGSEIKVVPRGRLLDYLPITFYKEIGFTEVVQRGIFSRRKNLIQPDNLMVGFLCYSVSHGGVRVAGAEGTWKDVYFGYPTDSNHLTLNVRADDKGSNACCGRSDNEEEC